MLLGTAIEYKDEKKTVTIFCGRHAACRFKSFFVNVKKLFFFILDKFMKNISYMDRSGIEPEASPMPRERSTPELPALKGKSHSAYS